MTKTDKVILKSLDCILQVLYVAHPEVYNFSIYQTLADQMKETHEYLKDQEEMEEAERKAAEEFKENLLIAMEHRLKMWENKKEVKKK